MINDNNLYFPYDNDPEPTKYTVLVQTRVWTYVDVEAIDTDDLKNRVKDLSEKKLFEKINEKEIEKAELEDGTELFDDSEEEYLRYKLKRFIKKFIEEGNKENQTLEDAYYRMFEFYKSEGYEKYFKK